MNLFQLPKSRDSLTNLALPASFINLDLVTEVWVENKAMLPILITDHHEGVSSFDVKARIGKDVYVLAHDLGSLFEVDHFFSSRLGTCYPVEM